MLCSALYVLGDLGTVQAQTEELVEPRDETHADSGGRAQARADGDVRTHGCIEARDLAVVNGCFKGFQACVPIFHMAIIAKCFALVLDEKRFYLAREFLGDKMYHTIVPGLNVKMHKLVDRGGDDRLSEQVDLVTKQANAAGYLQFHGFHEQRLMVINKSLIDASNKKPSSEAGARDTLPKIKCRATLSDLKNW
jgi:hypothetical protein